MLLDLRPLLASAPAAPAAQSGGATPPLIIQAPPPVHIHDVLSVHAIAYAAVSDEHAAGTWEASATTGTGIDDEQATVRMISRHRIGISVDVAHRSELGATMGGEATSPWDTIIEADDRLVLLGEF